MIAKIRSLFFKEKLLDIHWLRNNVRIKCTMYQRKVYVDILNAIKSVLADVSSVSPLSEQRTLVPKSKLEPTHSLRHSAYPHQPYVDTYCSTFYHHADAD